MRHAAWLVVTLVACNSGPSATQVVDRFYQQLKASQVSGAPTEAQLAGLAPYLGDSLKQLLTAARRQHDADVAKAPDEKPAFADGDLFSSLFEGPGTLVTEAGSSTGSVQRVLARMTYDSTRWTDTVIVGTENGKRVIQDIHFGGTWDFALKGSLQAQLSRGRAGSP